MELQVRKVEEIFFSGEVVTVVFLENIWKILAQPIATSGWAQLSEDLCPDDKVATLDIETHDKIAYCEGIELPATADNTRAGASGKGGTSQIPGNWVRYDIDLTPTGVILYVVTVQHHCTHVAVPEDFCTGQDGKFIRLAEESGDCKLEGHVLFKTSMMWCGDPEWKDQIDLTEQSVMTGAAFNSSGTCDYELTGNFETICTFPTAGDSTPDFPLGGTNFDTATAYNEFNLEYVPGEDPSDPSEVCTNPSLLLKGKAITVLTCGPETGSVGTLSNLLLEESTAYYRTETTTDSEGRKCIVLIPISFATFGDCDEGTGDPIICGNPCPEVSP